MGNELRKYGPDQIGDSDHLLLAANAILEEIQKLPAYFARSVNLCLDAHPDADLPFIWRHIVQHYYVVQDFFERTIKDVEILQYCIASKIYQAETSKLRPREPKLPQLIQMIDNIDLEIDCVRHQLHEIGERIRQSFQPYTPNAPVVF